MVRVIYYVVLLKKHKQTYLFFTMFVSDNDNDAQFDNHFIENSANSSNDESKCRNNIFYFIYFHFSIVICNNQIINTHIFMSMHITDDVANAMIQLTQTPIESPEKTTAEVVNKIRALKSKLF